MTYSPDIPLDTPSPSISVDFIRTNFSQFNTVFSNDHTALNNSNQGKHANVIFENQAIDPIITDNYDTLYSKSVTSNSSTSQEIFFKIPQFLPNPTLNIPTQLTFNTVSTVAPVYQSFLMGGYILYFGNVSAVGTVTLSPAPTEIVCAIANANNFTIIGTPIPFDVSVTVLNNFQFSINSSAATGTFTFTWVAIGRQ